MKFWEWLRARPKGEAWVAGGVAVGLVAAYACGRWMAPTRVETERIDVATSFASWDWKAESIWTQTAGPVHRETTTRSAPGRPAQPPVNGVCPECPEVEETTVVEDIGPVTTTAGTTTQAGGQEATETRTEERKVVERPGPRVALFGTVTLPATAGGVQPLLYGLTATANVIGPVSVLVGGAGGPQGGQATVGVGLAF